MAATATAGRRNPVGKTDYDWVAFVGVGRKYLGFPLEKQKLVSCEVSVGFAALDKQNINLQNLKNKMRVILRCLLQLKNPAQF